MGFIGVGKEIIHALQITNNYFIDKIEQFNELQKLDDWFLIFFSGGPSCGKCIMAKKNLPEIFNELSSKNLFIFTIEKDNLPELFERYDIKVYPKYALFKGSNLVQTRSGMGSIENTIEWIKQIIG